MSTLPNSHWWLDRAAVSRPQVVDLQTVKPAELHDLWECEVRLWRDYLLWDRSDMWVALQRVLEHGAMPGKAVRVGARTAGYTFYVIRGHLGVIIALSIGADSSHIDVGGTLLQATVDDIRRQGVQRIESQFVAIDRPWLIAAFEHVGFRTYWRDVLRSELYQASEPVLPRIAVQLQSWRGADLREAALIMQAAYDGGVDAELNQLYRTSGGCQEVLDSIMSQSGSGTVVAEASAIARHQGRGIGFIVITETAPRQGHLVQVAVHPQYQRQGVGRLLLDYSMSRLTALHFDTLSLIVSRSNHHARKMYQAMGFASKLSFPAFIWEP
jgi:ribosomal protein S18 acetylase RimI-like enzyme